MTKISVLMMGLLTGSAVDTAHAQVGTMTFNGNVVTYACQVSANGNSSGDATIQLPTVANSSLAAPGARAAQTRFDITVGTPAQPCTANAVRAQWVGAGANVDQNSGRLNNTAASGNAQGVQVAVLDSQQQDIDLRNSASSSWVPFTNGVAQMDYFGEYYGHGPVVEGLVDTSVEYQLDYN